MGTRSIVSFKGKTGTVSLYRHSDAHPQDMIPLLQGFFRWGRQTFKDMLQKAFESPDCFEEDIAGLFILYVSQEIQKERKGEWENYYFWQQMVPISGEHGDTRYEFEVDLTNMTTTIYELERGHLFKLEAHNLLGNVNLPTNSGALEGME